MMLFVGTVLLCVIMMFWLVTDVPTETEKKVMEYAQANGLSYYDYPESLIALLERNPETEEFVLGYPNRQELEVDLSKFDRSGGVPLFIQWDPMWGYGMYGSDFMAITGCGPTCLAMAGYDVTGDKKFSPDQVAAFAQENGYYSYGNGSSWTLISEGGPALGLDVTELPLEEGKIAAYLKAGDPIIAAMGPGDFTNSGHFIVLTGYDDGLLSVNDPNSYVNSEKTWSFEVFAQQVKNLWVIKAGE